MNKSEGVKKLRELGFTFEEAVKLLDSILDDFKKDEKYQMVKEMYIRQPDPNNIHYHDYCADSFFKYYTFEDDKEKKDGV